MTLISRIRNEPWDVEPRLSALGLAPSDTLRSVAEAAFSAWAEGTPNDPVPAPGYHFYAAATRTLREVLAPLGWRRLNESNQALVIHPSENRAIVVATGDENTG